MIIYSCTREGFSGFHNDLATGKPCAATSSGLYPLTCRFHPDGALGTTGSILFAEFLDNVSNV